jgi:hypothetical protein
MTFEKIDVLKDLENARMQLNNHSNALEETSIVLEDDNPPLDEHNVLDWGSEDSEVEPMLVVKSVKKSRSAKKRQEKSQRH